MYKEFGFMRVAVVSPDHQVADVGYNTRAMIKALGTASRKNCQLVLFPELAITGYTCADLFYQNLLLSEAKTALERIAQEAKGMGVCVGVGLPLTVQGRLYNCVAFIGDGRVLGIVPKSYLPSTNEYYEERWFTSGIEAAVSSVRLDDAEIPFGTNLLFRAANFPECVIGIEICEDLWAVQPPSSTQALSGATVLLNASASDDLLGKYDYRRDLVRQQSARCLAAYLYAGAGPGESTTDMVFGGHSMIAENGMILAEAERFRFETQMAIADIDVQRLNNERLRNSAFSAAHSFQNFEVVDFALHFARPKAGNGAVLRHISPTPFVPSDPAQRAKHCQEIFAIQSVGLAKRVIHTKAENLVIGTSGGLDSTLALLVAVKTLDKLKIPRAKIMAVMMPGFGTTDRTKGNAGRLVDLLGATPKVVPIQDAVEQHFQDIDHDHNNHDIVYENSQARERTQILMDLANEHAGLVLGTGDLSELALGWCTYNGDQMSMYNVNGGVPKTLVRFLVEWAADNEYSGSISDVLHDICATPITPELLPLGKGQTLQQMTEKSIGPYDLHDFFLFHTVRFQFSPRKIYWLARMAFKEDYSSPEILRWMKVFYQRFFSQQFKRSAMPDGPKVGSVALSPRGDWRMPSDATACLWLEELDTLRG